MPNGQCLKFNQEDVKIIEVDTDQEHFDFGITVAKESLDQFGAKDDPNMATHIVDRFNENYGTHWLAIVGDDLACAVDHKGNYAHFHLTQKYANKPRQQKYVVIYKVA